MVTPTVASYSNAAHLELDKLSNQSDGLSWFEPTRLTQGGLLVNVF